MRIAGLAIDSFVLCAGALVALSACSATPSAGASFDASSGDAAVDADVPDASADASGDAAVDAGACVLDVGADASACEACRAKKCCNTDSAQKAKPGTWTNSALQICSANSCATECALAAPKCGGITPDPASCVDALDAKCCAEVTACGQSDECVAVIYLCIDDAGNDPASAAFRTCAARYPQGLKLFRALDACFGTVTCP